ncbi:hypothetical protein [Lysinibacillus sphaericus]|nr:hypothetical protein [Lysinibacillus sphaericus]
MSDTYVTNVLDVPKLLFSAYGNVNLEVGTGGKGFLPWYLSNPNY